MELDYDYLRGLRAERIARSLAASGARRARAATGCPLERLVVWIASRGRAKLDAAALAR
jgi:hypothetical protein